MKRRGPTWIVIGSGGRQVLGALSALLVTPFALRRLGPEGFGMWALAGGLITALRLLDLGTARAVSREVAVARAGGEPGVVAPQVATARGLALLAGAGALVALWLGLPLLVPAGLRLDPESSAALIRLLLGTAMVALMEALFLPSQAALEGLGRMDRVNVIDGLVQRLASPLAVVPVLSLGGGLDGLVLKNGLMALAAGALYQRALRAESPPLAALRPRWDRREARRLLAYGRHPQLVNLASAAVDPLAKVMLGTSLGLGGVGVYELSARVSGQVGGACMAACAALFPAAARFSDHRGASRREQLLGLHAEASRWMARVVLPGWTILALLARPFCALWLGPPLADSVADGIRLLSPGWAVALLAIPAFLVNQAAGDARLSTRAGLTTAGGSLAGLMLGRGWGLDGMFIGLSLGLAAGGLVMLLAFSREQSLPLRCLLPDRRVLLSALVAGLVAAAPAPAGWIPLAAQAGLALAAAAGVLLLSRELDAQDLRRLAAGLRRGDQPQAPGGP